MARKLTLDPASPDATAAEADPSPEIVAAPGANLPETPWPLKPQTPALRVLEVGPGAAGTRHDPLGVLVLGARHDVPWAADGWRWLEPGAAPVPPDVLP